MIFGTRVFTLRSQAARHQNKSRQQHQNRIGGFIMKTLISAVAVAAALAIPALSFAQQSDAPVTRAQVRAELVQLEKAGYNPNVSDPSYPSNIQAAEASVNTQTLAQAQTQTSDYGSVTNGTSQAGRANAEQPRALSVFFGQ
jgi:hypothetical protein